MSDLIEILKHSTLILTAIASVVVAVYKLMTRIGSYNDRPFIRRNFRRLEMLERESGNHPAILEMLAIGRAEKAYRSLFGWHAAPSSLKAMSELVKTGVFAIADLKAAHSYMKIEHGRVTVKVGAGAWLMFWFLLAAVILLGICVFALAAALLIAPSMQAGVGVVGTAIVFSIFCLTTAPDARSVIVASRIRDKLSTISQSPQE